MLRDFDCVLGYLDLEGRRATIFDISGELGKQVTQPRRHGLFSDEVKHQSEFVRGWTKFERGEINTVSEVDVLVGEVLPSLTLHLTTKLLDRYHVAFFRRLTVVIRNIMEIARVIIPM